MKYYEHHIGDYAQATAHLSFVEDAAYSRLIRKYYAEEKPLPSDIKAVQRLVGARTKEERQAVETVLKEFFVLKVDGWHNERCDNEIALYRAKQEKARESASARWKKNPATTRRQQKNFSETEEQDGKSERPKYLNSLNASDANALRTQCERNANALLTNNQEPITNNQEPVDVDVDVYTRARTRESAAATPPADPIHARAVELAVLLRRRGAALQASDPRVRGWAERGVTDAQALAALETAQRQRAASVNAQPVNAGYLDAILRSQATASHSPHQPRRSIHDERAAVIAVLTGRHRPHADARVVDVAPSPAAEVG